MTSGYRFQKILSAPLRDWLLDESSLTGRLRAVCAGDFAVRVLSQAWRRPQTDERRLLGMKDHEFAFIRQVYLLCAGRPWVFARTVIPVRTLSGAERRLARLGSKPLGATLFADRTMERGGVELARIVPGHGLFNAAVAGLEERPREIWGRRSVFRLHDKPLLVGEIFLPPLIGYVNVQRRNK
jgi:chorismate--pyruvate lyase